MSTPAADTGAPRISPRIVHIARSAEGVDLYFPPLRAPAAALGLGAFGFLCIAIPAVAAAALLPASGLGPDALMVMVLIGGFALPIFFFGLVFVGLALYQLANALYVRVEPAGIAIARSAFGITVSRRRIARAEITAIAPQIPSRFQSPFSPETNYRLVAVCAAPARNAAVAESLPGAAAMEHVRMLIEETLGLPPREEDE